MGCCFLCHFPRGAVRLRIAAVLTFGLVGAFELSTAAAQALPPFPELLRQSEKLAPRLMEGEANLQVAQGLAHQSAALPNPTISYESENFGGSNNFARISPVQNTVSLSETIEIGGKRGARIAAEAANVEAARSGYELARVDFARDLATAYASCEMAQLRLQLLQEELARAQEDQRATRLLVEAGRESDLRSMQAQAALTHTQADLESARADLSEALINISTLAGASQPYSDVRPFLLLRANTLTLPAEDVPVQTPALRTAEAERETAARRVEVERKRPISDIAVSVGSRRLAGLDATALVAGVSVPLPILDRNRGAIAAQLAELHAADARLSRIRLELQGSWRVAFAQARAAGLRLKASNESEAAAREAYRLARIGYDAGRTPLIELLAIRRALSEAQLRAVEARFARVQAQINLSHLVGRIPFEDIP
jgi:cobalt-zinc-cadmium efflux system outer membrane protein